MKKFFPFFVRLFLLAVVIGSFGFLVLMSYFGRDLPDYRQLLTYSPPIVSRLYASDGQLVAEYAIEKRVFVPIEVVPDHVIQAFLSAEDKNFYSHSGLDFVGITRAVFTNINNLGTNRRLVGASTITQQVAKNFFLNNEVSVIRKVKEAILALRIEKTLDKARILELYLNEIYLGAGSYGVAAASLNYFGKSLDELTIPEAAYLAALPKAPNNYHPIRRAEAAKERRDWVIQRMFEDGVLTLEQRDAFQAQPLEAAHLKQTETLDAAYFAEEVRKFLIDEFGQDQLYEGGLFVKTTMDPDLQRYAEKALRRGLEKYDRRHGYRGPLTKILFDENWQEKLTTIDQETATGPHDLAVVLKVDAEKAGIYLADGRRGTIPLEQMTWARQQLKKNYLGPNIKAVTDVLKPGHVILVTPVKGSIYALRQKPEVNGAFMAMDPHTGRVLALVGGYDFEQSEFNRTTQAMRQSGSSIKPFVYLTALEKNYTPSTMILDAPIVINQGGDLGKWRPTNYSDTFYGPSTMRTGLEKSRNLMTIRLTQNIGIRPVTDTIEKFGVLDNAPHELSVALGSGDTTLWRMVTAYAQIANGGKVVQPTMIDRIQDRWGKTLYRSDQRVCPGCQPDEWMQQFMPEIPDERPQISDPVALYQLVSMMEGVIKRGTARSLRYVIDKPVAGKTGTSNDSFDTWFIGFTPDLVAGVFVGFDTPKSLGRRETGSNVAAPIFGDFMKRALKQKTAVPFRVPPGVRLVKVNQQTGKLAKAGDRRVILEAFKPGTEPSENDVTVIGGEEETEDGEIIIRPSESEVEGIY